MNRHRQRGHGRRGGQRMNGAGRRSAIPAGQMVENMQSGAPQLESPTQHGILDTLVNTASGIMNEFRRLPQKRHELPSLEKKPANYPVIDTVLCNGCGICADACPSNAISIDSTAVVNESLCTGCRECFDLCPRGAITFVEEGL